MNDRKSLINITSHDARLESFGASVSLSCRKDDRMTASQMNMISQAIDAHIEATNRLLSDLKFFRIDTTQIESDIDHLREQVLAHLEHRVSNGGLTSPAGDTNHLLREPVKRISISELQHLTTAELFGDTISFLTALMPFVQWGIDLTHDHSCQTNKIRIAVAKLTLRVIDAVRFFGPAFRMHAKLANQLVRRFDTFN